MPAGYGQFCPIAKASEIFAARWTPLILRELMAGMRSFNDIHRGVPLISRAVLVARLLELEDGGVIERRPRANGAGHECWLTPAGEGFRAVLHALGQWGMTYTRDLIKRSDLDSGLLMWGLRRRADLTALPDHRVVVRFEFSGVPASRTKFRIMWLVPERSGADVCVKDPGFDVIDELAAAAKQDPVAYRKALLGQRQHAKGTRVVGSYLSQVAEVEVATDGSVRIHRIVCAVDCGLVVNPDTIAAQMQGGTIFGLTAALHGAITLRDGRVEQGNFDSYRPMRIDEVPVIETHLVNSTEAPGGIGETATAAVAPAVTNAIFAVTGKRVRTLPIDTALLRSAAAPARGRS